MAVASKIFVGSLVFLCLYETKGDATPTTKYTVELIYVGTEYFLCLLWLAYPSTLIAEFKRDFSAIAALTPSINLAFDVSQCESSPECLT